MQRFVCAGSLAAALVVGTMAGPARVRGADGFDALAGLSWSRPRTEGPKKKSKKRKKRSLGRSKKRIPVPGTLGAIRINGPGHITKAVAARILKAAGYYHDRILAFHRNHGASNRYEAALMALHWGYTYDQPGGPVRLTTRLKKALWYEYRTLRKALVKYRKHPNVSADAKPRLMALWIRRAARRLRALPSSQRVPLMRSLMRVESGRTQWEKWIPVVSHSGAVGIGQFLPATARGLRINHHDPAQNIAAIARYVNALVERTGSLRQALAAYNGGASPPASSYAYADAILSGMHA